MSKCQGTFSLNFLKLFFGIKIPESSPLKAWWETGPSEAELLPFPNFVICYSLDSGDDDCVVYVVHEQQQLSASIYRRQATFSLKINQDNNSLLFGGNYSIF